MRIIAIFMIMVVHANYMTFGFPMAEEVAREPVKYFFYIGVENVTIICVNVFVLISGWFGIHFKMKSFLGFIFQSLFFGVIVQTFFGALGVYPFSMARFVKGVVTFLPFVNSYIVLYVLSPILNSFAESSNKSLFRNLLIVYFAWAIVYGWFFGNDEQVSSGKSAICFIGLYMLARYMRLYSSLAAKKRARFWGIAWATGVLALTLLECVVVFIPGVNRLSGVLLNMSTCYMSPNVLFFSVSFFLFFARLQFSSKAVNWIAGSVFSAVLLHGQMEDEVYCPLLRELYSCHSLAVFLAYAASVMLAFMIVGVLIDKIRIVLWNRLWRLFDRDEARE